MASITVEMLTFLTVRLTFETCDLTVAENSDYANTISIRHVVFIFRISWLVESKKSFDNFFFIPLFLMVNTRFGFR